MAPLTNPVILAGQANIGTGNTVVSWPNTPFVRVWAVILTPTVSQGAVWSVRGTVINASSFSAQVRTTACSCYFIVIGEGP